jgi:mitochondrial import receptor subunit TOM40
VQVATTGIVALSYHQKVSEKAGVAADFLFNPNAGESIASVGYDYMFRNSRLRGTVDSHGKVAAFLEETLVPGIKLLLSGELDHFRQDHKFGFGMTVGE